MSPFATRSSRHGRWLAVLLVVAAAAGGCEEPHDAVAEPSWRASVPGPLAAGEYRSVPEPCDALPDATLRRLIAPQPVTGVAPEPSGTESDGTCRWERRDAENVLTLQVKVQGYAAEDGRGATEMAAADFGDGRWSASGGTPVTGLGDQAATRWFFATDLRTAVLTVRLRNVIIDVRYESVGWWGEQHRALAFADVERGALAAAHDLLAGLPGGPVRSQPQGPAESPSTSPGELSAVRAACGAPKSQTVAKLVFGAREVDRSPTDATQRSACFWKAGDTRLALDVEVISRAALTGQNGTALATDLYAKWRERPGDLAGEPRAVSGLGDEAWWYDIRRTQDTSEVFLFVRLRNLLVSVRYTGALDAVPQLATSTLDIAKEVLAGYGAGQ